MNAETRCSPYMMFTPEEYLTKDQVLSQFSQMCAEKKFAQIINEPSEEQEHEEEATDQEVEVLQYILIDIFIYIYIF